MDTSDGARTVTALTKLPWLHGLDVDLTTDLTVAVLSSSIRFVWILICDELSVLSKGFDVSKEQNIQKHITVELCGTRHLAVQRSRRCQSRGMHSHCQGIVHDSRCFFEILRGVFTKVRSWHASCGLMHPFANSVSLRVPGSHWTIKDVCMVQHQLEFMFNELATVAMDASTWPWMHVCSLQSQELSNCCDT